MMPYCTSYFKFLSTWFWGVPEQNKDFAITTYGGGDPSLTRYSSKTAEQNLMKLLGIVHYMMPYCTSYFKFLFEWFWGFPEQNKDFAIQNMEVMYAAESDYKLKQLAKQFGREKTTTVLYYIVRLNHYIISC